MSDFMDEHVKVILVTVPAPVAYEYEVQMLTTYGWECVTTEVDRAAAIEQRDCYRANDPDNAYRYKRVRS